MVQNDLDEHSLVEKAGSLSFPSRYVGFSVQQACWYCLPLLTNAAGIKRGSFCNRV